MKRWILMILGLGLSLPMMGKLSYAGPLGESGPFSRSLASSDLLTPDLDGVEGIDQMDHGDYWDEYYDDFYYSRRLRRFHGNRTGYASGSWGYFDPRFTNDIYYVINTPYWGRWNDWYRPRRRGFVQTNFFLGGVSFNVGVYSTGWNPWGYDPWVYNDPWVNTYVYNYYDPFFVVGYNPWRNTFGWGWGCAYNRSFNRGWRRGYRNGFHAGFATGYNVGWYNAGGGGGFSNDYWWRRHDTRYANIARRPSTARTVNRYDLPQGNRPGARSPRTPGDRYERRPIDNGSNTARRSTPSTRQIEPGIRRSSTSTARSSSRTSQSPVRRYERNSYERTSPSRSSSSSSARSTQPASRSYERSSQSRTQTPSYQRTQPSQRSYERTSPSRSSSSSSARSTQSSRNQSYQRSQPNRSGSASRARRSQPSRNQSYQRSSPSRSSSPSRARSSSPSRSSGASRASSTRSGSRSAGSNRSSSRTSSARGSRRPL